MMEGYIILRINSLITILIIYSIFIHSLIHINYKGWKLRVYYKGKGLVIESIEDGDG